MNAILKIARSDILQMAGYRAAVQEPDMVRLHANEAPWRAVGDVSPDGLNRYPDPQPKRLVARLAALYGVDVGRVLVTRGSDDAIDLLVRAFCRAGQDSVLISPPTFGMYAVSAQIQGAAVVHSPLDHADNFALRARQVLTRCGPATKIVFVCSPNNPTGNLAAADQVASLCEHLADQSLVVVDEAYIEFAADESCAPMLARYPNLVVLRTLSKAFALAGARCGALLGNPDLLALLRRVMPPYPLSSPAADAAMRALDRDGRALAGQRIAALLEERRWLAAALARLPAVKKIWPSSANFLLLRTHDADRFLRAGRDGGVLIRDMSQQHGLAGCVRVTIGSRADNLRLLASLKGLT